MDSEIIPIKRYPNRRFYDRRTRKYVTLQDIEDLVAQGHTVDVRDSKSGEDLTRVILTQILLERHPERMTLFPTSLLHCMLRANDLTLEFLRCFLRQSLVMLEGFQKSTTAAPFVSPLEWMKPFFPSFVSESRGALERPSRPEPEPEELAPEELASEELARRVAALEERICRLEFAADERLPSNGTF
jgi:polyhydroxyalkanoate synthesis repressor PhaR